MSFRKTRLPFRNHAIFALVFFVHGFAIASIQDYSNKMYAVGFGVGQNRLSPKLEAQNGNSVEFEPNVKSYTKISFEYSYFALSINVPQEEEQDKTIYGKSDYDDYQFRFHFNQYVLDLFYQRYNSFYISNHEEVLASSTPYVSNDLKSKKHSLALTYTFNKDFSLSHAYATNVLQSRSSGSWLLQASINYNSLYNAGNRIIPSSSPNDYQGLQDLTKFAFTSFAFGPGYSYTLIWNYLYLNTTIVLAPNIKDKRFYFISTQQHDIELDALNAALKLALGWNSKKFKLGFDFQMDSSISELDDKSKVELSSNQINLMFHYRYFL